MKYIFLTMIIGLFTLALEVPVAQSETGKELEKWYGRKFMDYMTSNEHSKGGGQIENEENFYDTFGENEECQIKIFVKKDQVIERIEMTKGSYKKCERYFPKAASNKANLEQANVGMMAPPTRRPTNLESIRDEEGSRNNQLGRARMERDMEKQNGESGSNCGTPEQVAAFHHSRKLRDKILSLYQSCATAEDCIYYDFNGGFISRKDRVEDVWRCDIAVTQALLGKCSTETPNLYPIVEVDIPSSIECRNNRCQGIYSKPPKDWRKIWEKYSAKVPKRPFYESLKPECNALLKSLGKF